MLISMRYACFMYIMSMHGTVFKLFRISWHECCTNYSEYEFVVDNLWLRFHSMQMILKIAKKYVLHDKRLENLVNHCSFIVGIMRRFLEFSVLNRPHGMKLSKYVTSPN